MVVQSYHLTSQRDLDDVIAMFELQFLSPGVKGSTASDFYSMLKTCFYSLSLMPESCVPVLILVTDGVSANLDLGGYDDLLMQMHRADISLNVVDLGRNYAAEDVRITSFGCTRNSALLRFIAETTHGVYTTPQHLSNSYAEGTISKSLTRELQFHSPQVFPGEDSALFAEEYTVACSQSTYMRCRITEGFRTIEFQDGKIRMVKKWMHDVNIFVTVQNSDLKLQKVTISVTCPAPLRPDFQEVLLPVTPDRKHPPKLALRLRWFIEGMKETEVFAESIESAIQGKSANVLCKSFSSLPVSKLHRWLTLAQMYVVTARTKSQKMMNEGKVALETILERWADVCSVKDSCYVQILHDYTPSFALVKVTWEGKNVAVIHMCFYNTPSTLQQSIKQEMRLTIKENRHVVLFPRPISKLLVEPIFNENRMKSRQLSLFNYRPMADVVKNYLLHFHRMIKFASTQQAMICSELICRSRVREEFCYTGECEGTKWQFVKNVQLQSCVHNCKSLVPKSMLLYLAFDKDCELHIEIYFEPNEGFFEGCNEQEAFKMLIEYISKIDDYLANSVRAFQSVLLKCIEHKIGNVSEERDLGKKTMAETDDIYCYFPASTGSPDTYQELKVDFYTGLYEIHEKYASSEAEIEAQLEHVLDNLDPEGWEVRLFATFQEFGNGGKHLETLVREMKKSFQSVADYWIEARNRETYFRYISEYELLAWRLPFVEEIASNFSFKIEYYHCKLLSLVPESTIQPSFPFFGLQNFAHMESFELSKPLVNSALKLVEEAYYLSLAHSLSDYVQMSPASTVSSDVTDLLQKCRCIRHTIDIRDLRLLLIPPWENPESLARSLVTQSIQLQSDLFQSLDSECGALIGTYFQQLPGLHCFYVTIPGEILFLSLGEEADCVSKCLLMDEFEVRFHYLPSIGFFDQVMDQQFHLSSMQHNKLTPTAESVTSAIVSGICSSISARVLELYRHQLPLTADKLTCVSRNIDRLAGNALTTLTFHLQFTMQEKDFADLIAKELKDGQIINVRSFGEVFFMVTSEHFATFYSKEQLQMEYCPIDEYEADVYLEPYTVPFWLLFKVTEGNSITVRYHLPPHLRHVFLTLESVEKELQSLMHLLERRVAQRHLLKQLMESGNCSSLLFKEEDEPKDDHALNRSPTVAERVRDRAKTRRLDRKTTNSNKRVSPYTPEVYKPDLKYQHSFIISDRLAPDEATNYLLRKFSIPPFEVYNRKGLFMVHKDAYVFIFKFSECSNPGYKQRASFSIPLKTDAHAKNVGLCVRMVRLEVFGIDVLRQETVDGLVKKVHEELFQLSLVKLADALVKNQKFVMTVSDVAFIRGNTPMNSMWFRLSGVVSDHLALLRYAKQNLSRFLTSFKIKDAEHAEIEEVDGKLKYYSGSTFLLYNYMNILDSPLQKTQQKLSVSRQETEALYQGKIFGKALALINAEICYYDGNSSNPIEDFDLPDKLATRKLITNDEKIQDILADFDQMNPILLPQPSEPGFYLELRLSKNGPLNETLFKEHIHGCVKQTINEFCLELLFDMYRSIKCPLDSALEEMYSRAKQQILQAQNVRTCPAVVHYCPQAQLLEFAMKLSTIVTDKDTCEGLPIVYILKVDGGYCATSIFFSEIKSAWLSLCPAEKVIGKQVLFRVMMGPEAITRLLNLELKAGKTDEHKFYPDEMMLAVRTIPRTPYLSISLTNMSIEVLVYDLNKTIASTIMTQIEQELAGLRLRHGRMNDVLMQKLGIWSAATLEMSRADQSYVVQKDLFLQNLPKAFLLLEDKKPTSLPMKGAGEGGLGLSDEVLKYRIHGMYPLIKHGVKLDPRSDPEERHTETLKQLCECKRKMLNTCQSLIWVLKKWGANTERLSQLCDRTVESVAMSRSSEINVTKSISKECAFIATCDMAKVQLTAHFKQSKGRKADREEKKLKTLINKLVDAYAEKFRRNMSGFEYVAKLKEGKSRFRKVSTTDAGSRGSSGAEVMEKGSYPNLDAELKITHHSVLRKIMDDTMIIVEFRFEQSELSAFCFCVENFARSFSEGAKVDYAPSEALKKELNRVRGQLKTFSFLYEFQVRTTFQHLDSPREFPPIDVLEMLDAVMKFYKKPPPGSGAWLYRGIATVDLGGLSGGSEQELFLYLVHHCEQYHLRVLDSTGLIDDMVVYQLLEPDISTNRKDGTDKGKSAIQRAFLFQRVAETSSNKRLRPPILLDNIETSHKIRLRYFILNSDPSRKGRPYESFKDLKLTAEKTISDHMRRVREDHRRDQLYERLHDASRSAVFSFGDLQSLLKQSEVRKLEEIDKRIAGLIQTKAFDGKFIDYLREKYMNQYRLLENGDYKHLLLYRSTSQFAYLIVGIT